MLKSILIFPLLFSSALYAQTEPSLVTILQQMKFEAKDQLIDKYYPRNTDTVYGGYISSYSYDMKQTDDQDKMIVTQSRHIWSTAKAAEFYHDNSFLAASRHGFYFLRDKMWDKEYGGFYNLVERDGTPKSTMKEAYGNAFGVYALSALYKASKDTNVLALAKKAFMWLENHSHDPVAKGYFQHLERNGTPIKRPASTPSTSDLGYKDQNSSIHLLEAITELYGVWHDPLVKERLNEMLVLVRDVIVTPKGYLQLFFTPDWKPVTFADSSKEVILQHKSLDHVSFGHDVETAYLMMEASEALGIRNDRKTMAIGKKMVDHAIRNGWDTTVGGFYDEGYYFKDSANITIIGEGKNWWAQAEALNTFLIFAELYGKDKMHYFKLFTKQWSYIEKYLIDHEYGDWYEGGIDKEPAKKMGRKAHIWKGTYHSFRAMSNCIKKLKHMLGKKAGYLPEPT